uniref:uncharacterized protein n=1 Tax=Myxine glutinosa TaxID=7769 RepID=UPI00358F751D
MDQRDFKVRKPMAPPATDQQLRRVDTRRPVKPGLVSVNWKSFQEFLQQQTTKTKVVKGKESRDVKNLTGGRTPRKSMVQKEKPRGERFLTLERKGRTEARLGRRVGMKNREVVIKAGNINKRQSNIEGKRSRGVGGLKSKGPGKECGDGSMKCKEKGLYTSTEKSCAMSRSLKNPPKKQKIKSEMETDIEKSPGIWFDDVDLEVLADVGDWRCTSRLGDAAEVHGTCPRCAQSISRELALDCEMVGGGFSGRSNILARVSLVCRHGNVAYDTLVKPNEKITDWRSQVTGLNEQSLLEAPSEDGVRDKVLQLIQGRLLVGHALHNDLKVLKLNHPKDQIRDIQKCPVLHNWLQVRHPSLKVLAKNLLDMNIQGGAHDSVEDARVAMRLYTLVQDRWKA